VSGFSANALMAALPAPEMLIPAPKAAKPMDKPAPTARPNVSKVPEGVEVADWIVETVIALANPIGMSSASGRRNKAIIFLFISL